MGCAYDGYNVKVESSCDGYCEYPNRGGVRVPLLRDSRSEKPW